MLLAPLRFAADRVMAEAMEIDPASAGYRVFRGQAGPGQYDLSKIDIRGDKIEDVKMAYAIRTDPGNKLEWGQPMTDVPAPIKRERAGKLAVDADSFPRELPCSEFSGFDLTAGVRIGGGQLR